MKIQFRWVHNNHMDQQPELQFRRTDDLTNAFSKWVKVPHVYLDEPKKPKSRSISKKSVA